MDVMDANNDGKIDISDAQMLLDLLFRGGEPPPSPYPNIGLDLTFDNLGCMSYPSGRAGEGGGGAGDTSVEEVIKIIDEFDIDEKHKETIKDTLNLM